MGKPPIVSVGPFCLGCALSGLRFARPDSCGTPPSAASLLPARCPRLCPDVGHHFFCDKGFDGVADLHIVEVLNSDTAFLATRDFRSILFYSLQRSDLAFEDDHIVAQQAKLGISRDLSIRDVAPRDSHDFGNAERIANRGGAL